MHAYIVAIAGFLIGSVSCRRRYIVRVVGAFFYLLSVGFEHVN